MTSETRVGAGPALPRGGSALWFLGIMSLGYLAFTADRTVLSSMLSPLSAALQTGGVSVLGIAGTAWLVSAQFIGVLTFVLGSGHLADRYGQRRVILVGVAVFTAFTWLIGLSANLEEAFVFRLISGFGEGIFWPAAMSAVANYFGKSRGLALGIFYAGFDVGGAAGNAIGSATYSFTADWRVAFFVAPLLGLPVLAGVFASRRTFADAAAKTGALSLRRDAVSLLRQRRVAVLMVFAFMATWASIWQVAYLPYYYSKVLGASIPTAGLMAAAVLVSGMVGKILLGRISDRSSRNRILTVLALAVVAFYAVFFSTSDLWAGFGVALAMGFASSAIFPVMQALAADSAGGKTGTVLGLTTTFQSAAAVIGTLVPGALFSLGVGRALALGAMLPAVLMACSAFFLKDPRGGTGTASGFDL